MHRPEPKLALTPFPNPSSRSYFPTLSIVGFSCIISKSRIDSSILCCLPTRLDPDAHLRLGRVAHQVGVLRFAEGLAGGSSVTSRGRLGKQAAAGGAKVSGADRGGACRKGGPGGQTGGGARCEVRAASGGSSGERCSPAVGPGLDVTRVPTGPCGSSPGIEHAFGAMALA